ncbi:hypothetical protein CU098_011028 [Rhizopus stolonifer]|uniref:Uncharacterized protein n=1 Tax=Rhizopus stolonifer TaxID=4846 RepID=A0A367KQ99_RHIST|nr:hypothetical protein CU098_011028 [Rhizopus stolonifer]
MRSSFYNRENNSGQLRRSELSFKLNLRILSPAASKIIQNIAAEVAKLKTTTKDKVYHDNLMAVITGKCNLNKFVTLLLSLPIPELKKIRIPLVQIIGLKLMYLKLKLQLQLLRKDVIMKLLETILLSETSIKPITSITQLFNSRNDTFLVFLNWLCVIILETFLCL